MTLTHSGMDTKTVHSSDPPDERHSTIKERLERMEEKLDELIDALQEILEILQESSLIAPYLPFTDVETSIKGEGITYYNDWYNVNDDDVGFADEKTDVSETGSRAEDDTPF